MNRGIRSFHPIVCFLYYVGAAALVMLYKHPVFLFIGSIILILFNISLDKGETLKKWWKLLAILSVFFLLLTPLTNHRGSHILLYLHENPITLEAVIQGIILALSLFCLMVLFTSYNQVVTADKFLYLFSKWVPQWALLTMISMRFVPLLRRRLSDIELTQRSKGLSVKDGSLKQRSKNGIQFVQILLTWSLEEALQTADSMAARGYGLRKRSKYSPFQMKNRDWQALILLFLLSALGIFGWWLGDGVLSITPILEPIFLEGREWFYFTVFIAYIGFPLVIEEREALQWHYWKRKI
ncbi:energy-coupling factor transporter transmembrane component T [Bacillus sp. FJAT-49736]|uniref:energy-coupling factor transporter transmembrane component T n=1 Tax=Bacillus sp. FJAT-49736 TaxID=2833582 RepID=UPI001BC9304D|nr:energy-coupling factor transporter transmembrane component T [Bacillus sp. FJAT-49736]MBS4174009.1 energy-coupling factor transporter transmembrane protein EcfT [Bacillus sp. FJAT-49736]